MNTNAMSFPGAIAGPAASESAWHEARRRCIGASEAAAALGLSPYMTRRELYHRKRGEPPPTDDTLATRRGRSFEPWIVDAYKHATAARILAYPCRHYTLADYPHIGATPDAIVAHGQAAAFPLEAKRPGWRRAADFGPDGSDEIPVDYACQAQQQMLITGADRCDVAAMFDAETLHVYTVRRSERLISAIIEAETDLWERIQTGRPPAIDYTHANALDLAKSLYPVDEARTIDLSADGLELWRQLRKTRDAQRDAEKRADALEAELRELMAGASIARFPRGKAYLEIRQYPPALYTQADVEEIAAKIGQVKRRAYSRLSQKET